MASRQEKLERAEAEAKQASFDIADADQQREYEERPFQEQAVTHEEDKPGVFGSVFRKVTDTVGHAKDAVIGKSYQAAEKTKEGTYTAAEKTAEKSESAANAAQQKAGEYKDYTADKANQAKDKAAEYKDYSAEKTNEMKDSAARNANQAKDYTAEKAYEAKDYTADKAKQTKDYAVEKANQAKDKAVEYKDYTAEKANEAKDYTADKAKQTKDYAADKTNQAKDYTAEKAKETKDYAAEKANQAKDKAVEYKDYTAEKAGEAKDYTAEKAKDTKDYTAEKAVEGKDAAAGRLGGLAESAKGAARKAMDLFTGKKEEPKNAAADTATITRENLREAEEETRRKIEEMRIEHAADKDIEAERGSAAKETIYGNVGLGSIKESIKARLTQPEDVVAETRAAREQGGTGRKRDEEMVFVIEETKPGAVAEALKASDQMSGQAFNDVGRLDDEDRL